MPFSGLQRETASGVQKPQVVSVFYQEIETVEVRTHRTRVGSWELVFLVQKMKESNVF